MRHVYSINGRGGAKECSLMIFPRSDNDAVVMKPKASDGKRSWLLAALLLSGCASVFGDSDAASRDSPRELSSVERSSAPALTKRSVNMPRPPPAKAATDSAPVNTDSNVVGYSEDEVVMNFGAPKLITQQPPAVVWDYPSRSCRLSLFFYKDVNRDTFRVLTYEVEPAAIDPSVCIAEVRNRDG